MFVLGAIVLMAAAGVIVFVFVDGQIDRKADQLIDEVYDASANRITLTRERKAQLTKQLERYCKRVSFRKERDITHALCVLDTVRCVAPATV